jgi:hypothetical protein
MEAEQNEDVKGRLEKYKLTDSDEEDMGSAAKPVSKFSANNRSDRQETTPVKPRVKVGTLSEETRISE